MTQKNCLVYETLGKVSDLKVLEAKGDNLMRLEGVFGVCGVKNQNNRVYDKENYRQMVESLQQTIKETGCPGELEHPNSMNITLENVSHKIESIQMNEDGTITGTIALLNTPKGQIARAIVEGGLPLFISSRGAGTITNEGRVTLSTIKTYDLVGTPGFSQAKLTLKENQTLECLNESVEEGNVMYAIVEGDDDLLGGDDDEPKDDKKEEDSKKEDSKKEDSKEDKKEDEKKEEDKKEEKDDKKEDNKNNNKDEVNMNELKEAIDKLTDKVTSLEAELHVAQESLNETKESINPVNYDAIEKWVSEEFAKDFKGQVLEGINIDEMVDNKINEAMETMSTDLKNWVVEEFAPEVQNWVVEEFAPEVQGWITEEFAPEVQGWITEEFAPEVQNWITEEFAPEVQNWITEEFAPVIDNWINEEFAPEHTKNITDKVNENVSAFMEAQNAGRLEQIDSLLESISDDENSDVNKIVKEANEDNKFKGVYVVENMPAEYKPMWEMLSEERKNEIIRSSRMYDFTKEGVLESFWSNQDFDKKDAQFVTEQKNVTPTVTYQQSIISQMMHLRNANY